MHSHLINSYCRMGPSGMTHDLSPLARVIPLCSGTRVDSVSRHTGNFSIESRAANLRRLLRLPPYKPAAFSSTYSRILVRANGGSFGAASMRLTIDAERPEALWLALRMVQAVLRESPSALACSSSVRNPADLIASASSLILENCRARWVRARAAENRRNASDECVSMHRFPLNWPHGALQSNVRCREQLLTYHDV